MLSSPSPRVQGKRVREKGGETAAGQELTQQVLAGPVKSFYDETNGIESNCSGAISSVGRSAWDDSDPGENVPVFGTTPDATAVYTEWPSDGLVGGFAGMALSHVEHAGDLTVPLCFFPSLMPFLVSGFPPLCVPALFPFPPHLVSGMRQTFACFLLECARHPPSLASFPCSFLSSLLMGC
eukprot:1630285-Rhodomonas_salina.2